MAQENVFAEVRIRDPGVCQVASAAEPATTITDVSRTVPANEEGFVTEEFEIGNPDSADRPAAESLDEANGVYRLRRPKGQGCACELVERHECPVRRIHADDGRLSVAFYASDLRTVRQIVSDLRDNSDGVHLRRLYQPSDGSPTDLVYVDRDQFTDRQREALQTAHEMGYFDHPKDANAGEVATALNISTTTFVEHLSTAQAKLLERLFSE